MEKIIAKIGPPSFKTENIHMDVLSINNYLYYTLAGIGNYLFVFKNETLKFFQSIFVNERIHNIYVENDLVFLKGGKELAVVKLDMNEENIKCHCISHIQCFDWIQDVILLGKRLIGLVTTHNVFEVWDLDLKQCKQTMSCNEKCILYSCKIIGSSLENAVVFAGTVFGEIILWAPSLPSDKCIVQRLQAHTGAVFSIEINSKEKIFSTTSDDRSLRLWSVTSSDLLLGPEQWRESHIQLMHTLYGHTARVWKSLIISNFYITIGEDSQLIVWNGDGTLCKKLALHQESGIRSLYFSEKDQTISTGGEDGGINVISMQVLTSRNRLLINGRLLKYDNNFSARVCFTSVGYVYTTNGGCILVTGDVEKVIYQNEQFLKYCVLEVSSLGDHIALGSIKGHLVIINVLTKNIMFNAKYVDGKIYSIHWLNDFILTCTENGLLNLWSTSLKDLECIKNFRLPNCRERWTTCALLYCDNLMIGDRMGNVHVYNIKGSDVPVQSFKKIHSYLGVTDIVYDNNVIFTIGRDGTLKTFSESVIHLSTNKLPMDWLWRIVRYNNDKLILGFLGTSFVVWSEKYREIVASQECGGGHRSCSYVLEGDVLNFLFVKEKRIFVVQLPLDAVMRLRNGFHGKEINTLKIIKLDPTIVVTGSEDTTMRISKIAKTEIEVLQVLKVHLSSIRAVAFANYENGNSLIVSVGGKAQIVIWKFDIVSSKCEELMDHRLKNLNENSRRGNPMVDPETRFMCVDIIKDKNQFLVATGCSDRHVRLFTYDSTLILASETSYSHCILNITILNVDLLTYIVTFATNGKVAFWNVSENKNITQARDYILHQSGINCFAFEKTHSGKYILVTGGDDNMICVSSIYFLDGDIKLSVLWTNNKIHSCQVTGVKILDNIIISTSIDQRITLWTWCFVEDKFKIEYEDQYLTTVPDIQGMDAKRKSDHILLTIYGKGIETIIINDNRQ